MSSKHDTYFEIKSFVFSNIESFLRDARQYGSLDLTVAVNDDASVWNYQTGDNSFIGGAYGLPHWAVFTIETDTDPLNLYEDIICQLEDLLASVEVAV